MNHRDILVILCDSNNQIIEANENALSTFSRILKRSIIGSNLENVFLRMDIQSHVLYKEKMYSSFLDKNQNIYRYSDEKIYENGNIIGKIVILMNVTRHIFEFKQVKKLATIDSLTGLYNRNYFHEILNSLQNSYILIYAGLNSFKLLNETFGYEVGNQILKEVSNIIKDILPEEAIIGRYDGDDFLIICQNTSLFRNNTSKYENQLKKEIEKINIAQISPSVCIVSEEFSGGLECLKENIDIIHKNYEQKKVLDLKSSKNSIFESLRKTLEHSDYETKQHTDRTSILATKIGEKLNFDKSNLRQLSLLATFHDLGKIAIPTSILLKPSKLTDEEFEIMKTHSNKGYSIACSSPELSFIANGILHHHEKWDGSGYPNGLKGEEIGLDARIITIVDAFDVMIHDRPYKSAMPISDALKEIKRCSGTHFDPSLVEILEDIIMNDHKWSEMKCVVG
jgi:diguanylate cyclase (GGDEF)-like protein